MLSVTVQRDAVEAKAGEAADAYAKFMRVVGDDWDCLKGLKITLRDWREMVEGEKSEHLANKSAMTERQAKELAREINKLLGITREWRV